MIVFKKTCKTAYSQSLILNWKIYSVSQICMNFMGVDNSKNESELHRHPQPEIRRKSGSRDGRFQTIQVNDKWVKIIGYNKYIRFSR